MMRASSFSLPMALLVSLAGCSAARPHHRRPAEALATPPAESDASADPERRILLDQMRRMATEDAASVRR
jgi:hypothetical protein